MIHDEVWEFSALKYKIRSGVNPWVPDLGCWLGNEENITKHYATGVCEP